MCICLVIPEGDPAVVPFSHHGSSYDSALSECHLNPYSLWNPLKIPINLLNSSFPVVFPGTNFSECLFKNVPFWCITWPFPFKYSFFDYWTFSSVLTNRHSYWWHGRRMGQMLTKQTGGSFWRHRGLLRYRTKQGQWLKYQQQAYRQVCLRQWNQGNSCISCPFPMIYVPESID